MKNQYDLSEDGQTVTIWCYGQGAYHGCLIDIEDLPKVDSIRGTWYATWNPHVQGYYAKHGLRFRKSDGNRGLKTLLMHRLITEATAGLEVDHKNHETLDNRRGNLRIATRSVNGLNRRGADRDSRTGHRAISPHKATGKFQLLIHVNKKKKHIGLFSTIEEAIAARNKFPEYSQAS
jgi:hypothetical protein